jgi:hypothetical protein
MDFRLIVDAPDPPRGLVPAAPAEPARGDPPVRAGAPPALALRDVPRGLADALKPHQRERAVARVAREKETSDAGARLVRLHEQLLDGDVRVALEDLGGDALQGLLGEVRAVVPRGAVSVEDHEPVRARGLLDAEGVLAGLRGGFGVDGGTGGGGGRTLSRSLG